MAVQHRILSIDPAGRGFGFAIFEGKAIRLVDWGWSECRRGKKDRCMKNIQMLVEEYQPTTIVLEDCKDIQAWRCQNVRAFNRSIRKDVTQGNVTIDKYSRDAVKETFSHVGATTKEEIVRVIALTFPEVTPWLPRHREIWTSEDERMNIFDAVALGLTWFHHHGGVYLERLPASTLGE